jgi:multiple antibiotic resistance protein
MQGWAEYARFTVGLFAILTPFAAIPIFLSLTDGQSRPSRLRTARVASLTVFTVLIVAALSGEVLLELLGTSLPAFQVGGGIVLLLMALSMLNAKISAVQHTAEEADEAAARDAIGVVPLGIPLLAGPGSISSVIIQMQRSPAWLNKAITLGCVALVCLLLLIALQLATPIGNLLGKIGLNILNRLFGLLLAAIAVEIIANGLKALFPALG